ncbi:zinc transporter ZntB [Yoonia sp. 208BN28-4]|uniref:zinc transporter ZntB n=1 Tax=Yoonia sp. 208BN28-4 TaxID=3126505 RepID=UPI0030B394D5
MSSDFTPLLAYDIWPDGTATFAPDSNPVPCEGASLRWMHTDLQMHGLAQWCEDKLPPLASRTLLAARTRPRVDTHDDGLTITLRGINLNDGAEVEDMVSLRLWVTADLVVSVRKMRVFALDDLRDQIAQNDAPPTPARMIARITESLVDRIETVSLDLEDRASDMEITVYDQGDSPPPQLARLRRSVITLRRHIGPLSEALADLARVETPLIEKGFRNRLRHTANRAKRSVDEVHEVADRLNALSDHIDLHLEGRLARNSYVLSVIAAIFLPLGFLTGVFGVNVAGMPGTENPQAFAILCGAMVGLGVLVYLVLRIIKWF